MARLSDKISKLSLPTSGLRVDTVVTGDKVIPSGSTDFYDSYQVNTGETLTLKGDAIIHGDTILNGGDILLDGGEIR